VHLVESYTSEIEVWRNDEIDFERVSEFDKIILSPGPGLPVEAGQLNNLLYLNQYWVFAWVVRL